MIDAERIDGVPAVERLLLVRFLMNEGAEEVTVSGKVRVLVADDHPLLRDAVRDALGHSGEFEVVGQAGDGEEAVRLARELEPDVMIMDVLMPVKNGVDACREITDVLPDTRVLMLTASTASEAVVEAVAAGATGYLVKDTGADRLLGTLREVVVGRFDLTADELRRAAAHIRQSTSKLQVVSLEVLTPREKEVLRRFCQGLSYVEIAAEAEMSRSNVRNTIHRIHDKIGAGSNQEMVVWAVRVGLLD